MFSVSFLHGASAWVQALRWQREARVWHERAALPAKEENKPPSAQAHFLRACWVILKMVIKQKQISRKPFKCNLCGHFQHQPAKRQGSPLSSAHLGSAVLSPCTALLLTPCKLLCFSQPHTKATFLPLHTGTPKGYPHPPAPPPCPAWGKCQAEHRLILLVLPRLGKMWAAQTKNPTYLEVKGWAFQRRAQRKYSMLPMACRSWKSHTATHCCSRHSILLPASFILVLSPGNNLETQMHWPPNPLLLSLLNEIQINHVTAAPRVLRRPSAASTPRATLQEPLSEQNRGKVVFAGVAPAYNSPDYWQEAALPTEASLKLSSLMVFQTHCIKPQ